MTANRPMEEVSDVSSVCKLQSFIAHTTTTYERTTNSKKNVLSYFLIITYIGFQITQIIVQYIIGYHDVLLLKIDPFFGSRDLTET